MKPQGWRTAHIRKKQEWQNKLKNLRIGRKEVVEDKDKAEDSTMLAPFYDQNSLILKAQEQEAKVLPVYFSRSLFVAKACHLSLVLINFFSFLMAMFRHLMLVTWYKF